MSIRDRVMYWTFVMFGITLVVGFGVFWFQPAHVPQNFTGIAHVADLLLFALVTYTVWHPLIMEIFSWAVVARIKQRGQPAPPPGLDVAFVTTFVPSSESIELLYKTLPAMVNVDYPHDTWLLDEGNDPRVRELCKQFGVRHFSRSGKSHYNETEGKFAAKTKGGNHNSWYDSYGNTYDIVAQIDTDFVPVRSFLTKTLGYFRDPKVGFVGTPQVYGNVEESFIARGAAEQTYSFYGPILRGFSGFDSTLLIGANHVLRVKALQSVDHYSAHITEDLLTGMKLHAKGWKSVYVSEPLAIGEGPTDWRAYFNQQMRWAYGCMDILLKYSPKLLGKMSLQRALYYFFLQQHYFSGVAMVLGAIGLGLYFLLGLNMSDMDMTLFVLLYAPLVLTCMFIATWIQRFYVRPTEERGLHLAGKIISVAAWPIFFLAFIGVLRGKKLSYKVTPKGKNKKSTSRSVSIQLFKPHVTLGLFCLLCLVVGVFFFDRESPVMVFWLVLMLVSMLLVPLAEIMYDAYLLMGLAVKRVRR